MGSLTEIVPTWWMDYECDVCGNGFIDEWDYDNRHTGLNGEEYHDSCCPDCNEGWKLEEAREE